MKIKVRKWQLEGEKLVADCRVFKVKLKTFVHPDGRRGDFYVNESSDWVQVAPIIRDGKNGKIRTVLVKQFRFGIQEMSWEFSGGIVEKGESPAKAAARELLEETGYSGGKPKIVASYSPNPAIQNNLAHFAVMENCEKTAPTHWDENEEIETKLVDVDSLDSMVKSGKIVHSIAINSIYFLQKYLAEKSAKKNARHPRKHNATA